jgi:hypothetical protein
LPYNKDPDTGSLMPSISTGGAEINPIKNANTAMPIKGKH